MNNTTDTIKVTTSTIIPTLRYHDARAAIDWLCEAFGFQENLVVPGEEGAIRHAQLIFGNGMIMLGSVRDDEYGSKLQTPRQSAGPGSQAPYIIVSDADIHYHRAVAAGAEIVIEVQDADYGGRLYSCLDPEKNLWNFGTYDPWND